MNYVNPRSSSAEGRFVNRFALFLFFFSFFLFKARGVWGRFSSLCISVVFIMMHLWWNLRSKRYFTMMCSTQLCLIKLVFILSVIRFFQIFVFEFNSFRYKSIGTRIGRVCMSVSMSHPTKDTSLSMSEQRDGDLSGYCSPTGGILKYGRWSSIYWAWIEPGTPRTRRNTRPWVLS